MKKRNFITLILGVIMVALGFLYPIIYSAIAPPSSEEPVFVLGVLISICSRLFLGVLTILFSIIGFIFPKVIKENCPVSTTVIAIAISFCGAAGLCSIISFADTDPANTPILAVIASICCILVLTLVLLYIHFRKKYPSSGGVCIDIFIVILTFIPFLFIYTDILDIIDMFTTL